MERERLEKDEKVMGREWVGLRGMGWGERNWRRMGKEGKRGG